MRMALVIFLGKNQSTGLETISGKQENSFPLWVPPSDLWNPGGRVSRACVAVLLMLPSYVNINLTK